MCCTGGYDGDAHIPWPMLHVEGGAYKDLFKVSHEQKRRDTVIIPCFAYTTH